MATSPDWMNDPNFSGLDPQVKSAFQQSGLTPSMTRGSGFADVPYWTSVGPSQSARWASDILGTGTDQPTGTPGIGQWQQSGRGGSQPQTASPLNASGQADQILAQVEGNMNGLIQQLLGQGQNPAQ